jgi:hypothetical protein
MPVAFITNDFTRLKDGTDVPGGCAYYRCSLPMFACGQPGKLGRPAFHPSHGFGIKETDTRAVFGFDTVVLKLIMFRWTPRQMLIAQQLGQRIIVDIDDSYDFLPESNRAWEVTHPDRNRVMNRDHYRRVIEQADIVTVSTPFLLEHHAKTHPDVRMIRNGVYPDMFHVKPQSRKPVIGWVGAIPFRSGDLETLRDWLPGFLEKHDLLFHHAGDGFGNVKFHEVVGIPEQRVRYQDGAPMSHYGDLLTQFDVGLVPLTDIPFNHAKSCIKGLEYASAGIPFVAQDLPEYRMLAASGVGRVASSPSEWVAHLEDLLDLGTRKIEAARGRDVTVGQHSIMCREPEWQALLAPNDGGRNRVKSFLAASAAS